MTAVTVRSEVVDLRVPVEVEQLLDEACRNAKHAYKAGRPGWGEYLLAKAALQVARLTNCQATVEQLGDLVYVKAGLAPVRIEGGASHV